MSELLEIFFNKIYLEENLFGVNLDIYVFIHIYFTTIKLLI